MAGFIIVVTVSIIASHVNQTRTLNEAYGLVASRFHGTLHESGWGYKPSVTFGHRGFRAWVDVYSTGGKHSV
ncbi:MAG: hypothetical protein N2C14_11075, partial [Planctomycetales bacterium]